VAFKRPTGKSFEELLIERGLLTKEKLQELLTKITREKKSLEQLLMESGFSEEKIAAIKAEYLGYEFVDLSSYPQLPLDLLKHIKPAYAKNYPLSYLS
jgi:hypothetical protein